MVVGGGGWWVVVVVVDAVVILSWRQSVPKVVLVVVVDVHQTNMNHVASNQHVDMFIRTYKKNIKIAS